MKEEHVKTKDVEITEDVSFRDMMLSGQVLAGLTKCNFEKPSPIQLRAIPIGRCGLDLIIQSKSGTGKTLVYCTIILERYNPELKTPQALIVVPTREIALQVETYLNSIGSSCTGFSVTSVIGGRDIADDRKRISKCRAIVGTPGRILHLIKNNFVCLQNIQTLVLDEADKLMTDNFYSDINILLNALCKNRQIIASSATYANGLDKLIVSLMQNPIAVSTSRETPVLIGIKQFVMPVEKFSFPNSVENSTPSIQAMWRKVAAVEYILKTTSYKQCILFSNSQLRATSFANYLTQNKWTVELVLGSHDQNTRTAIMQKFRQYKSRIMVTSDLMARGVDIVNVNLVINLDVPSDSSTYLHRIGRCGRFGRRGLAITFAHDDTELNKFRKLLGIIGGSKLKVATFPINLDSNANFDAWNSADYADSSDSYVFGLADDENATEIKVEPPNEKSDNDTQVNGKQVDSVESNNLNLLEVAKLLVDTEPNKQNTIDIDDDLFSNFQNCDAGYGTISVDLFEDFAQSMNKENHLPNDLQQQEEFSALLLNKSKNNEVSSNEEVLSLINLSESESSIKTEKTENTGKIGKTKKTKEIVSKKTEHLEKSHHKTSNHSKSSRPSMEPPTPNALWAQIYWQQLNDIHQYIANSHSQRH